MSTKKINLQLKLDGLWNCLLVTPYFSATRWFIPIYSTTTIYVYEFLVLLVYFSLPTPLSLFHSQFDTSIIKGELPNSTWEWDAILYILIGCTYFLLLCACVHDMRHRENKDHNLNVYNESVSVNTAQPMWVYWCTKMNREGSEHIGWDISSSCFQQCSSVSLLYCV